MNNIYPVFTTVAREPQTICKEIDERVFEFPFFNEGVNAVKKSSKELHDLSSVETSTEDEILELKGFIFNASHCGSTLMCRMLNQIKVVKVISESEAINGLLLSKVLYSLSDEEVMNRLIKIIRLYQQSCGSKRFLVIKFTSWNVYFIDLITKAFSETKWIYLDRETEALTESLMKSDGGFIDWWQHPTDELRKYFLYDRTDVRNKEEYIRAMISGHRVHANKAKSRNGIFLDYPGFMKKHEEIINHFRLKATEEEISNLEKALTYDSKSMTNRVWRKT